MSLQFKILQSKVYNPITCTSNLTIFWRYTAEEHTEYPQLITKLSPKNLTMQHGWKVIFEKRGKLMPYKENK